MDLNNNARWTDNEDHRLSELSASGKSHLAMSDVLGRSASAIEQRLYILRDRQAQKTSNGRHDGVTHKIRDGRMIPKPAE